MALPDVIQIIREHVRTIPPRMIPLAIAIGLGLVMALSLLLPHRAPPSPLVGRILPSFMLPRVDDIHKSLMPRDFYGQPALLNVFSSWCVPCRAEQPLLMQLSGKVRIYGIAWRDTAENVSAYLSETGNPYQAVALDKIPVTTVTLGIFGVPTTYLVDEKGVIRAKWDTPLDQQMIDKELLPKLEEIQANAKK